MNVLAFVVTLLGPVLAIAIALPGYGGTSAFRGCLEPSAGFINTSAQMASLQTFMAQGDDNTVQWEMETIPLYVHIISATDEQKAGSGTVDKATVNNQLDVLNRAYESAGFRFNLREVSRVFDNDLSVANANEDVIRDAGRILRKGGWDALNLYVVEELSCLGVCTWLPWEAFDGMGAYRGDAYGDGCMIMWNSMPPHQIGHTATHEIGHWLGLLHTFHDGCSETNDFVHDTPAHLEPPADTWSKCDAQPPRNTCPDLPGEDPVSNFMNYMVDECMVGNFTWGQANRMHLWWEARKKALPPL